MYIIKVLLSANSAGDTVFFVLLSNNVIYLSISQL